MQTFAYVPKTLPGTEMPFLLLLLSQVIYEGKTKQCHPKGAGAVRVVEEGKHHITQTPTHWADYDTTQEYIQKVVVPHYQRVCKDNGFTPGKQKMLLIIDCWGVHCCRSFR